MDLNIDNVDGEGVNVTHDGGVSAEARDANLDDYVVDENNVNDEDEEFQVGNYDDNEYGDNESGYGDSDSADDGECYDRDANDNDAVGDDFDENSNSFNESTHSDQNPDESYLIDDVDDIVKMDMFNLKNEDDH